MTDPHTQVRNPFALLMDPQSVFRAIEASERLERLHSRICRPLDKPLLPHAAAETAASFDKAIESSGDDFFVDDLPGEPV
jgi:hypothetical protein